MGMELSMMFILRMTKKLNKIVSKGDKLQGNDQQRFVELLATILYYSFA